MVYNATHESSMISASSYDTETSSLIVTFVGGKSYSYENVTNEDYTSFVNGESTGRSFNEFIRKYNGVSTEETVNEMVTEIANANIEGTQING